jgi:hypothetical protein
MSLIIIINIGVNYHVRLFKSCMLVLIIVNQYIAHFDLLLFMLSRVVLRAAATTRVSPNDQIPFLLVIINRCLLSYEALEVLYVSVNDIQ